MRKISRDRGDFSLGWLPNASEASSSRSAPLAQRQEREIRGHRRYGETNDETCYGVSTCWHPCFCSCGVSIFSPGLSHRGEVLSYPWWMLHSPLDVTFLPRTHAEPYTARQSLHPPSAEKAQTSRADRPRKLQRVALWIRWIDGIGSIDLGQRPFETGHQSMCNCTELCLIGERW